MKEMLNDRLHWFIEASGAEAHLEVMTSALYALWKCRKKIYSLASTLLKDYFGF